MRTLVLIVATLAYTLPAFADCVTRCTTDPLMINGGQKCTTVCR